MAIYPLENGGSFHRYVNVYQRVYVQPTIAMSCGKIHYVDWAIFNDYVSLPECKPPLITIKFPMKNH